MAGCGALAVVVMLSCGGQANRAAKHPADTDVLRAPGRTDSVPHDPDDPAVWVHPTDPSRSLIVATDKHESTGGLYVYGIDGRQRQAVMPLDRPNNVDVEYGVRVGGRTVDIAVVTERRERRLRVFAFRRDGTGVDEIVPGGVPVLGGQAGPAGEPMGIALYKRPADLVVFAIVAPKSGGSTDYLWQYRLVDDGRALKGEFVRRFGSFSGLGPVPGEEGEIEAVAVDDQLGFVYYSDERFGIRKWHADPDHPGAGRELAAFGLEGYQGDREGLAVFARGDGTGYLVSSDQVPSGTRLHLYPREGTAGRPHEHPRLAVIQTEADETDGLEVVSHPLPGYPGGLLVMMNSTPRNYLLFDWWQVARRVTGSDGPQRP
jgi:3-phytase